MAKQKSESEVLIRLRAENAQAKQVIKDTENAMKKLGVETEKTSKGTKKLSFATLEAARAFEDFQFAGIKGIVNNLSQMGVLLGGPLIGAITTGLVVAISSASGVFKAGAENISEFQAQLKQFRDTAMESNEEVFKAEQEAFETFLENQKTKLAALKEEADFRRQEAVNIATRAGNEDALALLALEESPVDDSQKVREKAEIAARGVREKAQKDREAVSGRDIPILNQIFQGFEKRNAIDLALTNAEVLRHLDQQQAVGGQRAIEHQKGRIREIREEGTLDGKGFDQPSDATRAMNDEFDYLDVLEQEYIDLAAQADVTRVALDKQIKSHREATEANEKEIESLREKLELQRTADKDAIATITSTEDVDLAKIEGARDKKLREIAQKESEIKQRGIEKAAKEKEAADKKAAADKVKADREAVRVQKALEREKKTAFSKEEAARNTIQDIAFETAQEGVSSALKISDLSPREEAALQSVKSDLATKGNDVPDMMTAIRLLHQILSNEQTSERRQTDAARRLRELEIAFAQLQRRGHVLYPSVGN